MFDESVIDTTKSKERYEDMLGGPTPDPNNNENIDLNMASAPDRVKPTAILNEALDCIEKFSLTVRENKKLGSGTGKGQPINFDQICQEARKALSGNSTTDEAHQIIRTVIEKLGDNHSYLWPPQPQSDDQVTTKTTMPEGNLIQEHEIKIAYLKVPYLMNPDNNEQGEFASTLHNLIKDFNQEAPAGWIVDLQGNGGGNMWPMLAGIGPLLGKEGGVVGGCQGPGAEDSQDWTYENGASYFSDFGYPLCQASRPYEGVIEEDIPVAVLTDQNTASSGEAIAVAFKGRANTKSFGAETYGVPTAIKQFPLPDGSILGLTTGRFRDRDKNQYDSAIAPDERAESPLEAAKEWIRKTLSSE